MSVFTLDKGHPLTRAGLRFVRVVQKAELGLQRGDVVFEFPYGRIVDTGKACRRERIIPRGVDIMTIHKETTALGHLVMKPGMKRNIAKSCRLDGRSSSKHSMAFS